MKNVKDETTVLLVSKNDHTTTTAASSYESLLSLEGEHFVPLVGGETDETNGDFSSDSSYHSAWFQWKTAQEDEPDGYAKEDHGSDAHWNIAGLLDLWTVQLLGFDSNPCLGDDDSASTTTITDNNQKNNSRPADMRLSMISNFSTSYNILSVSLALHLMSGMHPMRLGDHDLTICSSALLWGMILGQLAGGTLGDVLGRHRAMTLVMLLQIVAAFGSACSTPLQFWNVRLSIYQTLAMWRFVLGLGCGGVYPLAATLTAESSQQPHVRAKSVALTFSMQGVGYLVVPLLAWILIYILGETSSLAWRFLLGVGAFPGLFLAIHRNYARRRSKGRTIQQQQHGKEVDDGDTEERFQPKTDDPPLPPSIWQAIRSESNLLPKLAGTAGCWFLFDVLYYGNTLFQPIVLKAVFGASESTLSMARDSTTIALMALPGYFLSVAMVGYQSPRYIQLQGFLVMTILYGIIGKTFDSLSSHRATMLFLYGASFFFADYGPNTTTFMLPSMTFSPACRSTLNGCSAACGKLGAVVGATLFAPAAKALGNDVVMFLCALLSLVGALLTMLFVQPNVGVGSSSSSTKKSGGPAGGRNDGVVGLTTSSRKPSAPSLLDF